ncbi:MAG: CPBP family intramembrane metalloprotease [Bacilli bacterium]|nr:CPBP family intramembrane metalloprotease [Bacilli bacterium]
MSLFIYKKHCSRCEKDYECTLSKCPSCGEENENLRGNDAFKNDIHVHPLRNIFLFLTGLLGLQIIATIISFFIQRDFLIKFLSENPEASQAEIATAWKAEVTANPGINMFVNGLSYAILAVALIAILWTGLKEVAKSFASLKTIGIGIIGGVAAIGLSIFLSFITGILRPTTTSNDNQASIVAITSGGYGLWAIIIFGFVGPFCEEVTYRIGLFTFLKRLNKTLAYVLTGVIFGLIHFNWGVFQGEGDIINEFVNLPDYIAAGLLFSYIYDKYGFGASTTEHVFNNVVSLSIVLLGS